MKILGISVVKNEDDVLMEAYTAFMHWCDYVAVVDNASKDGTGKLLKELEKRYPNRFFLAKTTDEPFADSLRRYAYEKLKPLASAGDWWCRLDPDEIFEEDPREFLPRIPFYESVVTSIHKQYYFTKEDFEEWDLINDKPLKERIRYFKFDGFSEQRFWRHRNFHHWEANASFPSKMGAISGRHISIRHYKYRSPQQIKKRLETRLDAHKKGYHNWATSDPDDWMKGLPKRGELRTSSDGADLSFALEDRKIHYFLKIFRTLLEQIKEQFK